MENKNQNTDQENIDFENNMITVDIDNVPIFSTGKWEGKGTPPGGMNITGKTLEQWVSTFQEIGNLIKPRLRLSHNLQDSKSATGMASLGWITNLKTDGKTLFASLKSVPKKISDLIDKKAFGRFSPGVFQKLNINGQDYSGVLEHVALLGAALPANTDLDGFIDLYYENENIDYNELCIYENYKGAAMDFEAKFLELEKKLELQSKEYELNQQELESKTEKLLSEKVELESKISNIEFEKQRSEVISFLEKQVDEKNITPAQKTSYEELLIPGNKTLEFSASFDIVKDIIKNGSVDLPGEEESVKGDISEIAYSKKVDEKDEPDLDSEIRAYMKESNIDDYGEAYNIVTYQKNLEEQEENNVS